MTIAGVTVLGASVSLTMPAVNTRKLLIIKKVMTVFIVGERASESF